MKKINLAVLFGAFSVSGMAAFATAPVHQGYSENGDYQAVVNQQINTTELRGPVSHTYSENGDYQAAPAR